MKAIKYIAAIALLAGFVSCQKEFNPVAQTVPGTQPDKVKVSFNVQFPEPVAVETKAPMGEGPKIADGFDIGFCIYGSGDGFVQNWIPADLDEPITDSNGYIIGGKFSIWLPLTDEKRTVHVIANVPEGVAPVTNDYIDNVMEKLVGKDNEGSYWQEIVLTNGIRQHYDEATSGFVPDDDLVQALSNINLVRNFAKITTASYDPSSDKYEKFQVKRWALINVPTKGYVAPYTGNSASRFPKGYLNIQDYPGPDVLLNQLRGTQTGQDNYPGSIPPEAVIDESFPGDPDDPANAAKYTVGGGSFYMYERPLPTSTQKQTAVLIEVEFDADHALTLAYNADHYDEATHTYDEGFPVNSVTYWYKVEALDQGQYVPFYRNVAYLLRIKGIEGEGEATAEAAYNGSYFGNISASLETASLNELSDGKSTIHVDVMDYTFLTGGTVTLMKNETEAARFWFIPDVSFPTVDAPAAYTHSVDGVCDIKVELLGVDGYEPSLAEVTANEDGSIVVTLNEPATKIKKSKIRVSGRIGDNEPTNFNRYIYREIIVNLMETQKFEYNGNRPFISNPPIVDQVNQPVDIKLYLPEDLGASIFPIQVRIESENNTLSATSPDLPVTTGKTVFGDGTRNTYFFIRTITYDEYCHLDPRTKKYVYKHEYLMTFKTNKSSNNSSEIDIRDLAGNFANASITLTTVEP